MTEKVFFADIMICGTMAKETFYFMEKRCCAGEVYRYDKSNRCKISYSGEDLFL